MSKKQIMISIHENGKRPERIIRANTWTRAIIRSIHAEVRANADSLDMIEIIYNEIKPIVVAKNKSMALQEYRNLLNLKPFEKLGVNV